MNIKALFKHRFLTVAALLLFIGATACDNGFQELNENPNSPTDAPAEFVLPRAMQTTMDLYYDMDGVNGYMGSLFAQHYAKIQYTDEDTYNFAGRYGLPNSIWEDFYAESLEDLHQIKLKAQNQDQPNIEAIATIMMAFNFQVASDLWGDIPYSEALQGQAEDKNITPAYDSQEDIYKGLIQDLKDAAAMIDEGSSPFGGPDLIYSGDMTKWKKLANSLQLRLYMRMSEADPSTAESGISDLYNNASLFSSHSDEAKLEYLPYPDNNPVNDFQRDREDHKISAAVTTRMKDLDDPRLRIYAAPVNSQELKDEGTMYQGVVNGSESNYLPLNETSTMGAYFISPTSPGFIMTYTEVKFILAEAAARGWIGADAETMYNEAVTAAMTQYSEDRIAPVLSSLSGTLVYNKHGLSTDEYPSGITQQEIDDYLAQPDVAWDPGASQADKLDKIALQKWFSLYGQGMEAWSDWRRTGIPDISPGPEAVLDQIPTRFFYPSTEASLNNSSRQEAVSSLEDGDSMTSTVWWDQ